MVFTPMRTFSSALVITARISRMPLVTAEKSMNAARVLPAMMRASVVLPTPGGPQKIMELMRSLSIRRRSTFPSPSRCRCPTNSSSVSGLSRAASGCAAPPANSVPCSIALTSPVIAQISNDIVPWPRAGCKGPRRGRGMGRGGSGGSGGSGRSRRTGGRTESKKGRAGERAQKRPARRGVHGFCRAHGAAGAWSKVPRVPMSPISKGVVW